MIAANDSHPLGFENLSGLPAWLSNALCRLATVAVSPCGSSTPRMSLLLVNGIEDVIAERADRGIFLTLAPSGERRRCSKAELWREFESREAPHSWRAR